MVVEKAMDLRREVKAAIKSTCVTKGRKGKRIINQMHQNGTKFPGEAIGNEEMPPAGRIKEDEEFFK